MRTLLRTLTSGPRALQTTPRAAAIGTTISALACCAALTACGPLAPGDGAGTEDQVAELTGALTGPGPQILSVSPNTGPVNGGSRLTITGRNFRPGMQVTIAGQAPGYIQFVSSTTLTMSLPAKAGAFGRVPVTVTSPDGKSTTRSDLFYYYSDKFMTRGAGHFGDGVANRTATGDINGDGKPDMVFTSQSSNKVGIALGGGLLSTPRLLDLSGEGPTDITLADVNGDRKLDLVVASSSVPTGGVLVFPGNGDGTFAAAVRAFSLKTVSLVFAQDLNGDGKVDLLGASDESFFSDATYQFFAGKGDGTFEAAKILSLPTTRYDELALLDVTGDGKPDLLRATRSGTELLVFPGKGDGTFGSGVLGAKLTDISAGSVAFGDVNGDGKADVLYSRTSTKPPGLLLGKGDGTFSGPTDAGEPRDNPEFALGDVNGDGRADLVTSNWTDGSALYLSRGDGTFGARQVFSRRALYNMTFLDLTGDKLPELISGDLSQLLNTGTGFTDAESVPTGKSAALRLGDVNGDGAADLIVASYDKAAVRVALGLGGGRFGTGRLFTTGNGPNGVALGDFNTDGKLDLVVSNYDGNSVSLLLGSGDGTFATPRHFTVGTGPTGLTVADLNGDGKLDVATSNYGSDTASVLLGNGTGGFAAAKTYQAQKLPTAIASGDLNGDGKADMVVTNSESGSISVLLSTTSGFSAAKHIPVGPNPLSLVVTDLNGDGKPDVAVTTTDDNRVSVLLNSGTGTLTAAPQIPTCAFPTSITTADLDGDSRSDLAVSCEGDTRVAYYLGFGDGVFFPSANSESPQSSALVAFADLNGDGKTDVVYTDEERQDATAMLNTTP